MARPMNLSRTEAEFLVDLIEASDAFLYIASELREQWGMCKKEDDKTPKSEFCPCCGRDNLHGNQPGRGFGGAK
jgi:hypothetical protein